MFVLNKKKEIENKLRIRKDYRNLNTLVKYIRNKV